MKADKYNMKVNLKVTPVIIWELAGTTKARVKKTTGLFINKNYLTRTLEINLEDYDPITGHAVWQTDLDGEKRYTEGHIDDDGWLIINRAFHAHDDERGVE